MSVRKLWPKVSDGMIKILIRFVSQNKIEFDSSLLLPVQVLEFDSSLLLPVQVLEIFLPLQVPQNPSREITKTNFVSSPPVRHPFPTEASKISVWQHANRSNRQIRS